MREDVWVLDISRWDHVAIMGVGRVDRIGVEDKLAGRKFGMMDANKESFFFFNNSFNFSMKFRKFILKMFMDASVA